MGGTEMHSATIMSFALLRKVSVSIKSVMGIANALELIRFIIRITPRIVLIICLLTLELTRQKAPAFWSGVVTGYAMISFFVLTYNIKLQQENARDYQRTGQNTT